MHLSGVPCSKTPVAKRPSSVMQSAPRHGHHQMDSFAARQLEPTFLPFLFRQ
jgi:hypothetical protein